MPVVHVTGTDRRYNTVVALEEGGQWRLFMPFPAHKIHAAAVVGNDRIVCLSDQSEVCLIEWRSDTVIARVHIPELWGRHVFATADAEFIVIYGSDSHLTSGRRRHTIHVLRSSTLETVVEGSAIERLEGRSVGRLVDRANGLSESGELLDIQILEKMVEDQAGRLLFICCDGAPLSAASRRWFCRFDRADWSIALDPIPDEAGPWIWFSPSGRYVLARHLGTPSISEAPGGPEEGIRGVVREEYRRNRHLLELWQTEPPRLISVVTTRKGVEPRRIDDATWESDETGFWLKFGQWSTSTEFQRAGIGGTLSPVFGFERFHERRDSTLQDIAGCADPEKVEIRTFEDSVYIQRGWCNCACQVKLISKSEDGFRRQTQTYPPTRLVTQCLAKWDRRHVVVVEEFSKAAVLDALKRLTVDIRERFSSLIQDGVFEISFRVGKRSVSETAFFSRLVRERLPVAAAIRDLIRTYLKAQRQAVETGKVFQICGPEKQGPLGPAMLALLRLDPGAHDLFRSYLANRYQEHENYSTNVIMKVYVKEAGWRDLAMLRFGIYFALIRYRDDEGFGPGGLLDEYGLLRAAEKMIPPDQFGAAIVQEVEQFIVSPGLELGAMNDVYVALRSSLETTGYGRETLATMASITDPNLLLRPEERGWGPASLDFLQPGRTIH